MLQFVCLLCDDFPRFTRLEVYMYVVNYDGYAFTSVW